MSTDIKNLETDYKNLVSEIAKLQAQQSLVLAEYAKQYNMLVLMANHNRETGSWKPIGKSAIWSEKGLLARANKTDNALVIAERSSDNWQAKVVYL